MASFEQIRDKAIAWNELSEDFGYMTIAMLVMAIILVVVTGPVSVPSVIAYTCATLSGALMIGSTVVSNRYVAEPEFQKHVLS
jgi:hypothetical protein